MPLLIRSACLTGFADLVRSSGLDPVRLLQAVGIDRVCLVNPDIKIRHDAIAALLEDPVVTARIPDLGLRLAEDRRLTNMGPVALAIRNASTVREAMLINIRYLPLHNEAVMLSLETTAEVTVLKTDIMAETHLPGRQCIELAVAVRYRLIREISGARWRPPLVWFSHSAPKNLTTHHRVFGRWVEFGRDFNGLIFEPGDLDAPLDSSDPVMTAHVRQYLDPLLAQMDLSLADKTKRLVQDLLISRRASADLVAAGLGLNRRSFQRQLAQDGTTFCSILDGVRTDMARRYLFDDGLPLGDVAGRLGFSAQSGFSRWFRAEFGCSPLVWRSTELAQRRATETG